MPNLKIVMPKELGRLEREAFGRMTQGREICLHCKHFRSRLAEWREDVEVNWTRYRGDTTFEDILLRVLGSAVEWVGGCSATAEFAPYGVNQLVQVWREVWWDSTCHVFCRIEGRPCVGEGHIQSRGDNSDEERHDQDR